MRGPDNTLTDRRHKLDIDGDVNVKLQGALYGQCGHETFVMDWITGCLKEVKKKHSVDWKSQNLINVKVNRRVNLDIIFVVLMNVVWCQHSHSNCKRIQVCLTLF